MTESQPAGFESVPRDGPASPDHRPLPAFVAAAGVVVVFLLLQFVLLAVVGVYGWAASRFSENLLEILANSAASLRGEILPMAIILVVSFLFFWGIAPIHSALRLGQVLGRGIAAAVASGVIAGVALVIQYTVVLSAPPVNTSGTPRLQDILRGIGEAGVQSATSFTQTAVYIVLAALILWNWMRVHPQSVASVDAPIDSPPDASMTV